MSEFKEDITAFPVLLALHEALAAELARSSLDEVSNIIVAPGTGVAPDLGDDCDSFGWVQLGDMYPSTVFPEADNAPERAWGQMAFSVDVGILRCGPMLDGSEPPSAAEYLEFTRVQLADMAAIRRAICACLNRLDRAYVLGTYVPIGPEGGQVGGSWGVTVQWLKG